MPKILRKEEDAYISKEKIGKKESFDFSPKKTMRDNSIESQLQEIQEKLNNLSS